MASANTKSSPTLANSPVVVSMRCACIATHSDDGSLPDLRHAAHMFRKLRKPVLLLQFLGPSLRKAVTAQSPQKKVCSSRSPAHVVAPN